MLALFPILLFTLLTLSLPATPTFSISIPGRRRRFTLRRRSLRPNPPSFGIIIHKTPSTFTSSASLSSNITFEIGNGVSLVIVPADFPSRFAKNTSFEFLDENRFLSIEFNGNLCKISSSRVSSVSKTPNILKSGLKLASWIDYHAGLKRIDVRLSKLGDSKPADPVISYRVDLGKILKGEQVLLGLASFNERIEQIIPVYSWCYEIKEAPKWLHSIPVNSLEHSTLKASKNCFVSGLVYATGCGALAKG